MTIKIMQLCFGDGFAGSAKMALMGSIELMKKKYDIQFCTTKGSLTEKRALAEGLVVSSFDTSKNNKNLKNEIFQKFEEIKPDIVICNHSLERKMGILLRRKYKKSFINIAYRHNMSESFPVVGSLLYNIYYDYSIACGEGVGESLRKSGISKKKIKVIHYGIEIPSDVDSISGDKVRAKYNLEGKTLIGNSAWFHKQRKGFDILFKAFSKLDENYKLMVIGIPNEKQQEVYDFAKEFNIAKDDLIMPGYVENVWEYYKAMDIFVFPSRSEGFPLAPLEAGAAKLPIVASIIPGTIEYIIEGKTGLLFNTENPEELLNGIKKLSFNKTYANELAKNANESVYKNYTLKRYGEKLDLFFKEITAKNN